MRNKGSGNRKSIRTKEIQILGGGKNPERRGTGWGNTRGSQRKGIHETIVPVLPTVIGCFMPAIPAVTVVLLGISGLMRYKWILIGIEILLLLLLLFVLENRDDNRETGEMTGLLQKTLPEETAQTGEDWEEFFREMDENEEIKGCSEPERERAAGPGKDDAAQTIDADRGNVQTVLLTARPVNPETHYLRSLSGGEEIQVGYFPFLIGKSRDLTDFCLNDPAVSRLHLRIDQTKSGYTATDLNSTNGTGINGHLLEANETFPLAPGDEVMIAARRYRFF